MAKLVKAVTDMMNAKPEQNTVFPAESFDALLHRICLDDVRSEREVPQMVTKANAPGKDNASDVE
ncbi:hypothetical protein FN846DRAFT_912198 [Sphaerosporella brunnea]|uniref:Uncharacterized protein n=1 Tax=Sphaerosporella brunnea TaxID=1250544 RepID=A0A5J5EH72_9PEZI|nr:hypothetical protein FN846DRAFT_912198 [Sphaerosporella brunnea]